MYKATRLRTVYTLTLTLVDLTGNPDAGTTVGNSGVELVIASSLMATCQSALVVLTLQQK